MFGDSPSAQALGLRGGITHVAESESGLMADDRRTSAPPLAVRNVADPAAGIAGFGAVCAALYEREKTTTGRHVEVSMTATAAVFNLVNVTAAQMSSVVDANRYAGMGFYAAADGHVAFGANSDHLWARLVNAMGLTELASDPRFATLKERNSRADMADAAIEEWTSLRSREEIIAVVAPTGVACGSVRTVQEVIADSEARALGIVFDVDDGYGDLVASSGNPWGFVQPHPRFPKCGEGTADVLREMLGLGSEEAMELANAGAFGRLRPSMEDKEH
jgi:crotonobetainyl-CoA:carnitine CoA-transferase CaiB-like acyl-CoA transferase